MDGWYSVTSDTLGWLVCPAGRTGSSTASIFFGNDFFGYNDPFATSGAFALTIPGGRISDYNPGIYTNNPNVTLTVTTIPIPEPSGPVLLGLASTFVCVTNRRRPALGSPHLSYNDGSPPQTLQGHIQH